MGPGANDHRQGGRQMGRAVWSERPAALAFFSYFISSVAIVCQEAHILWCMCGGQRTTLWSRFSPSTFMCVSGIKSSLGSSPLLPLNHLAAPAPSVLSSQMG